MTINVLCIGDVMLDVIARINVSPQKINYGSDTASRISTSSGGAAGNVAAWLTRTDARSTIVSHVGDDPAGAAIVAEFDALGVNHGDLIIPGETSGVVVVLVDSSGERTMFPDKGANSRLTVTDLPDLGSFQAVYISGYALLNPLARDGVLAMIEKIKADGLPIYFDPASVGAMKDVADKELHNWFSMMDVLFLNEEESIYLTGSVDIERALDYLLDFSQVVVIKRGSAGAIAKARGFDSISLPAVAATVVDTTGAGDSFAAGFIASYSKDHDLTAALQAGGELAAGCVAIVGGRPRVGTAI
ncbi:sugar kinase, ribokinase family protein [Candidatus Planktophila lacus]|uniref:carbohydrate kinase family protein n=1 Tax=Candidatus Planktophila lacus TaxID=1884913 RepID=UPI000BAC4E85|nr:carbohydrate kinase family protein [Candidatus Planktophila lacus]ASY28870.1 sugar kinase, ribokinase family protein [Candidatus Planktophila lacus]